MSNPTPKPRPSRNSKKPLSKMHEKFNLVAKPGSWYQVKSGRQKKKIVPCVWAEIDKNNCLVNAERTRSYYLTGLCYICGKEFSLFYT